MGTETYACNSPILCIRRSRNRSGCGARIGRAGGDSSGRPFCARKDHADHSRPAATWHRRRPADRRPETRGAGARATSAATYDHFVERADALTGITSTEIADR
jgi:hypothetical protein